MNIKLTIEMDEAAVRALEKRAAERGVSVSELIAEFAGDARTAGADELAELDHRWSSIERGAPTVAHEEVVRWLGHWGTPTFRPWPGR